MKTKTKTKRKAPEGEWICDVCGNKFSRRHNLKAHKMYAHSNEKPFQCKVCKRRFARKWCLTQHQQRVVPCTEGERYR